MRRHGSDGVISGGKHASRASSFAGYGGYKSQLKSLDEVKDEVTASPPATSPTGMYERIEMLDVLQVGAGDGRASGDASVVTTEPESETGDGDSVSLPPPPLTSSTILSAVELDDTSAKRSGEARYFTYDVRTPTASSVSSAKIDVHVSATDFESGFSLVESPGHRIRATDSLQPSGAESTKEDDKRNSKEANTHF